MKVLFERIQPIIPHNKTFRALYVLMGVWTYFWLYFGQSNFFTTAYTYSLVGLIAYGLLKFFRASTNIHLTVFSLLIALFVTGFTPRYVIRYPLSYGERNGSSYIILYRYNKMSNIRFKYIEGRKDLYTLQFDSGEIRSNDCGEYKYPNDTCNALGFRGALPDKNKKINLVLGDSFTEGTGAPADSSFPELLRQYITAHDTSTDVLNAGVSGNDIFFDWQMVHKLENKYSIKQLLFMMNTTDVFDVANRGGNERFRPHGFLEFKPSAWWEPVYAVSFVLRLFVHNALGIDYSLQTPKQVTEAHTQAIGQISDLIKNQIALWSIKKGIEVKIILHPLAMETDTVHPPLGYYQVLDSLQKIERIFILDCMPPIIKTPNTQNLYWKNDGHFKPVGYGIIAGYTIENIFKPQYEPATNSKQE